MFFQKQLKPISVTWVIRLLLAVIVFLSVAAGYFYTENQKLRKNCDFTVENQGELPKTYTLFPCYPNGLE